MKILYDDNHLLIIEKPPGILTQPSGTDEENLETLAKLWIKQNYNKPGNVFLEAVHRLDKPVGGIVIFAKTSKALSRLNASMRNKEISKKYLAVVEGTPSHTEDTLTHSLLHKSHKAEVASPKHPEAKVAILKYKVTEKQNDRSILEITLITGRYHQIRCQLAAIGHPVIGDTKYGSKFPQDKGVILLHHHYLELPHPVTKEILTFHSIPPFISKD